MFRNSAPDKSRHSATRRKVLRGVAVMLAGSAIKVRDVFGADASKRDLRQSLTQMAFHLFPHDGLAWSHYEEIAEYLLGQSSGDRALADLLVSGVNQLDDGIPSSWIEETEAEQIGRIERIEGGGFFRVLRSTTIEHLYRNKAVWQLIGYEGSSLEYGGYVGRGFDDIDWLPDADEKR